MGKSVLEEQVHSWSRFIPAGPVAVGNSILEQVHSWSKFLPAGPMTVSKSMLEQVHSWSRFIPAGPVAPREGHAGTGAPQSKCGCG